MTVQLRSKGNLTIPSEFRQKYSFDEGDVFTLVDLGDGSFYLIPRVSIVPKLVSEMVHLREEAGLTLEDMLDGLSDERQKLYQERYADLGDILQ
ncbi:AbrB/MazE/SpoVT family DNA-binding domain-containing protein [Chloroflexi bacterium TSY]|nr:AbrB/MazE/SpoVT family DNA-binding domain-containing protein [Chloroflexi bacterium TSY]